MLKSWTLSPFQGSVGNGSARRPALASLVWNAVSAICSGARMRSVRNAPSVLPETTSMRRPRMSVERAVIPFRARLAHQRQAGDQRGMFGVGDLAAAQPRLLIELLHQAVAGM